MSLPAAILLGLILAAAALVVDHFIRASIRRKRLAEGRERAAAVMEKAEREAKSRLEEAELEARLKVSEALDRAEKESAARARVLEETVLSPRGRVTILESRNLLIVTDVAEPQVMARARTTASLLDR